MGGHRQYQRLAKPMGMVDLDENEFDNFLKLKRKGGIFDRLAKCSKQAKATRFSSKDAKKDFLKDCMEKSGAKDKKAIKKKTEKLVSKVKANMKKIAEKNKKIAEEKMQETPQARKMEIPVSTTAETQTNTTPQTTGGGKNKKLLLYGAIGVVALIIGIKIIKR